MKAYYLASFVGILLAFPVWAGEDEDEAPEPAVTIVVGPGQGTARPFRQGSSRTGGGNIHITQPAPDTLSVTMTGAVAAKGNPCKPSLACFAFDLAQCFEVVFHSPEVKKAKLVMWGRTVGLLRSHCHCCKHGGTAEIWAPGYAAVSCGPAEILTLSLCPRSVAGGENLSVHDREGPVWAPVVPGKYTLRQVFGITATYGKALFGKPASAEFAPDPALEADWMSKKEPFHGAEKKDFGFQIILKVIPDEEGAGKNEK